jgi:hypothetical protein
VTDPDILEQPEPDNGDMMIGPQGATIMLPGGEVRIGRDGVGIQGPDYEAVRDRIEEARQRAEENYERARERLEEQTPEPD